MGIQMANYNPLFFDLDGTLTDSAPGIYNSIRYALGEMKVPVPDEAELKQFIGPPLTHSFAKYCGMNEEDALEAVRLYRVYFNDKGWQENSVYPGIPESLERLKDAGFKMMVATSKPEDFAVRIVRRFGIDGYFDGVYGASMDLKRSTKTEVIEYALESLGIADTSKVLMVGDREYDVLGAARFGMDCMGVLFGFGSRKELEDAGAAMIAETPEEIAEMLLPGSESII